MEIWKIGNGKISGKYWEYETVDNIKSEPIRKTGSVGNLENRKREKIRKIGNMEI